MLFRSCNQYWFDKQNGMMVPNLDKNHLLNYKIMLISKSVNQSQHTSIDVTC
jgi:hypothetical protein